MDIVSYFTFFRNLSTLINKIHFGTPPLKLHFSEEPRTIDTGTKLHSINFIMVFFAHLKVAPALPPSLLSIFAPSLLLLLIAFALFVLFFAPDLPSATHKKTLLVYTKLQVWRVTTGSV